MFKGKSLFICVLVFIVHSIAAQSHISVPLGHQVYHVIEQAQLRGLYRLLPTVKPYSRAMVLSIIGEILENNEIQKFGKLTRQEREILEQFRETFGPDIKGLDLLRGTYSVENIWNEIYFSGEFGFGSNLGFSGAYFPEAGGFERGISENPLATDPFAGANHPAAGDSYYGLNAGIYFSFMGDLGRNLSYGLTLGGGFMKAPRTILGRNNTFSAGWINDREDDKARVNRLINVYSEPLTYFPYTYKMNWDGSVWFIGSMDAGGFEGWPQDLSFGYYMIPEMTGALLNGHVHYRFAKLDREWSGMTGSSSLVLNQAAQPFFAGEVTFIPFTWLSFSSLTGVLEYGMMLETGTSGIKDAAETFQNIFSVNVLEINYRNYFHIDFGSSTLWPKRLELGYIFPLADTFFYQNNIGDFDNSALFLNIMGQYPGLTKLWFSLYLDEISFGDINRDFFSKSRMMIAYQFGGRVHIPWFERLAFSSLTLSYTRIEPYTYTHTREDVPWYGDLPMETNYVNRGRSLGHYLPPNSDEVLVRVDTMPALSTMLSFQYQLIRHGAEYGDRAVGGSSLWSELDPRGRETKPNLRKYFLHDGAYQWMHVFKLSGEYSLTGFNIPVKLFAEAGGVYYYFTDVEGPVNSGSKPYSRVNNSPEYPRSLSFIGVLGVSIFPK